MPKIKFDESNRKYYSEDFIKGFKCGVERQYKADHKAWLNIPYNATNGDAIKVLFHKIEITINKKLGEKGTVFADVGDNIIIFDLDWWNTPYKREVEDK